MIPNRTSTSVRRVRSSHPRPQELQETRSSTRPSRVYLHLLLDESDESSMHRQQDRAPGRQGAKCCATATRALRRERVKSYRGTFAYEKALRKRRVWVEPLFGEAKDWHGMRRFGLRRLEKVNIEALLIASGQRT
jgi:Transposase DDE domain